MPQRGQTLATEGSLLSSWAGWAATVSAGPSRMQFTIARSTGWQGLGVVRSYRCPVTKAAIDVPAATWALSRRAG